jgi:hypothetical protein
VSTARACSNGKQVGKLAAPQCRGVEATLCGIGRMTSGPHRILIFQEFPNCTKIHNVEIRKSIASQLQTLWDFSRGKRDEGEQFSFLAQHPNPHGFWSKNSGTNPNLGLVWILKGFKPFGKNSTNSPKFFLDLIFNTVNLAWLTCIKKFDVFYNW